MPNHVTNIMTVTGPADKMAELKSVWFREGLPDSKSSADFPDVVVDFNGLLPMPKELDIVSGSMSSRALEWLKILEMQDTRLLSAQEIGKLWIKSDLEKHTDALVDWQTETVGRLKAVVATEAGLPEKIGFDRKYLEQIQHNSVLPSIPHGRHRSRYLPSWPKPFPMSGWRLNTLTKVVFLPVFLWFQTACL